MFDINHLSHRHFKGYYHYVKQKHPFSSLFHNKFELYKEKHFFTENNMLCLTTQLLRVVVCTGTVL